MTQSRTFSHKFQHLHWLKILCLHETYAFKNANYQTYVRYPFTIEVQTEMYNKRKEELKLYDANAALITEYEK